MVVSFRSPCCRAFLVAVCLVQAARTHAQGVPAWCEDGGSKSTYVDRGLPMDDNDLLALEAFRDSITNDFGLLSNWNNASHPCEWCGVLCMCDVQVSFVSRICERSARRPLSKTP